MSALLLALCGVPAMASDFGSAADARALLERAVEALREDETAALVRFNQAGGAFRDRDLYVFCAGPDGRTTAHANPAEIGNAMRDLLDARGTPFGAQVLAAATEGRIETVSYAWPRPGETTPADKTSFVTRVGGQACGVGYYDRP